ncbi:type II toxin-antitoxin system RelE/ParE family toxin [Flavobacterium enshiense]|uniref:Killer suppression protein HigA n=1 Tax=Flavobacterium enshiense DK69 TaxID=1107311 RepID=A0A0A2MS84_9FLAO|nr:type II toxin-antitoxin system RelE/ParE family toxin [Flavobacterium enshiense]KGO94466.1 killer suppression protein HigA [Flavobacterium enshiense DK69]
MNITFDNKKLGKYANNDRLAQKEMGKHRADLFKQRLDDLRAVTTLEDTKYLPGNFHELKSNRKGQWACDLDHPYRLIFEPHEDPIPTNDDGQYLWTEIKGVEIIEVVDYHKQK